MVQQTHFAGAMVLSCLFLPGKAGQYLHELCQGHPLASCYNRLNISGLATYLEASGTATGATNRPNGGASIPATLLEASGTYSLLERAYEAVYQAQSVTIADFQKIANSIRLKL